MDPQSTLEQQIAILYCPLMPNVRVAGSVTTISGEQPKSSEVRSGEQQAKRNPQRPESQTARRPKPSQWLKVLLDSAEPQKPKAQPISQSFQGEHSSAKPPSAKRYSHIPEVDTTTNKCAGPGIKRNITKSS